MKKPKRIKTIKRIKIDRTETKPKGINLNTIIKDTLAKMREGKLSRSILTKKTNQKNVFLIKLITSSGFTALTLRKMRDHLKQSGLQILDSTSQTTLNPRGSGEKSFVTFKVRVRPRQVDTGIRSRKTMKKVLAFIGEL